MNTLGDVYIHMSNIHGQMEISFRIPKSDFLKDSKVLVGRGRKTGGQWLTCAAKRSFD